MGREIRQVPIGWEHPKKEYLRGLKIVEDYKPLFDNDVQTAFQEWLDDYAKWINGELELTMKEYPGYGYKSDEPYRAFCEYHGNPPDPEYYRPLWPANTVMGFAVYETVSEGTPVTPTFATKEELADYLATVGTYWDEKPWGKEAAYAFVKAGYAFSMAVISGKIIRPSDKEMWEDK